MRRHLLNVAEILQVLGFTLPPDPDRSAADTELLFEEHYQRLSITRYTCTEDTDAGEVHVYSLSGQTGAEEALVLESPPGVRTKMMLARYLLLAEALEEDETLEAAWANNSLVALQNRAAPLLPEAPPPAAVGRGRAGGGRRARGRGRGA